jgi:Type VI secretion system/phage-baseplate injector OB domain
MSSMSPVTGNGKAKAFSGKYRGTVVNNIDPDGQGRLLVAVPDILGNDPCIWAESASPVAGSEMGLYAIPPIGAGVWVELQQEDPDHAIWTGCWRGSSSDVPSKATAAPPALPPVILQTQAQNRLIISSTPGECLTVETGQGELGPRIVVTATGITLTSGKGASIELTGAGVKINGNALTVDAV